MGNRLNGCVTSQVESSNIEPLTNIFLTGGHSTGKTTIVKQAHIIYHNINSILQGGYYRDVIRED